MSEILVRCTFSRAGGQERMSEFQRPAPLDFFPQVEGGARARQHRAMTEIRKRIKKTDLLFPLRRKSKIEKNIFDYFQIWVIEATLGPT